MKRILTILFSLILAATTFAKGGSGKYCIVGKAYGTNKTILKNVDLIVKIGGKIKAIKTDSNGRFAIEVPWESACRSIRTIGQHRQDNKKLNPEFIYICYEDKEIKLKNKWKKYADVFPETKAKATRNKNLHLT